jgi:hypothetical protein
MKFKISLNRVVLIVLAILITATHILHNACTDSDIRLLLDVVMYIFILFGIIRFCYTGISIRLKVISLSVILLICILHIFPIGYVHNGKIDFIAPEFSNEDKERIEHYLDKVDVRPLDLHIWTLNEKFVENVLWDTFANTKHEQHFIVNTRNWLNSWNTCQINLLKKADAQGLDARSLEACLVSIKPKTGSVLASIPCAAYSAKHCGIDIWIVVIKREIEDAEHDTCMGHIAIYAFRRWSRELIALNSCL